MRVAVIGAGLNGLGAALELAKAGVNVVIYEKEESLVGHAKTVTVDGVDLDLGFMVFNPEDLVQTPRVGRLKAKVRMIPNRFHKKNMS